MEQTFWQRYCDIRDEQWEAEHEAARGDEIRRAYWIDAITAWPLRALWWGQIGIVLALMWLLMPSEPAPAHATLPSVHATPPAPAAAVANGPHFDI